MLVAAHHGGNHPVTVSARDCGASKGAKMESARGRVQHLKLVVRAKAPEAACLPLLFNCHGRYMGTALHQALTLTIWNAAHACRRPGIRLAVEKCTGVTDAVERAGWGVLRAEGGRGAKVHTSDEIR